MSINGITSAGFNGTQAAPRALDSGLRGISSGLRGMAAAAQDIAASGVPRTGADGETQAGGVEDAVTAAVDLKLYERQVEASAVVVKAADEALGTLIDTLA